jgi:hypothetical protein
MIRLRFTLVFGLSIVLIGSLDSYGQHVVDDQLWVNYSLTVKHKNSWSFGGDMGWRRSLDLVNSDQFLIRPTVTYKINNTFKVAAATALFYTNFYHVGDVYEFRLHQEVTAKWPRFQFGHFMWRFRLDERWLHYDFQATQLDVRGRLLVGFQTRDFHILKKHAVYGLGMIEGFRTLNEEKPSVLLMNRDRFYAAMGYRFNNKWRLELHYIWQLSIIPLLENLETTERIIRIRVYHTLGANH